MRFPTDAPTPRAPQPPYLWPKATAVVIRTILKRAFPTCTFRVRIGRGSGVSSVDVKWSDGPTRRAVDALIMHLKAGEFDGMTDSYDYKRGADRYCIVDGTTYVRGCQYIFTSREISPAFRQRIAEALSDLWGDLPAPTFDQYGRAPREADAHAKARTGRTWSELIREAAEDRTRAVPHRTGGA